MQKSIYKTEIYIQKRQSLTVRLSFPFTYKLITKIFRGLLRNAVDSFGKTGKSFWRSYFCD